MRLVSTRTLLLLRTVNEAYDCMQAMAANDARQLA
jgi:hypothetical protein